MGDEKQKKAIDEFDAALKDAKKSIDTLFDEMSNKMDDVFKASAEVFKKSEKILKEAKASPPKESPKDQPKESVGTHLYEVLKWLRK